MAKHLLLVFVAAVVTIQSHALPSSASQVMRSYARSNPKVRDAIVEASAASFQETANDNEELKVNKEYCDGTHVYENTGVWPGRFPGSVTSCQKACKELAHQRFSFWPKKGGCRCANPGDPMKSVGYAVLSGSVECVEAASCTNEVSDWCTDEVKEPSTYDCSDSCVDKNPKKKEFGECSCTDLKCPQMWQCIQYRYDTATNQRAKQACDNVWAGKYGASPGLLDLADTGVEVEMPQKCEISDEKCCHELLRPCKEWNDKCFKQIAAGGGWFLGIYKDGTANKTAQELGSVEPTPRPPPWALNATLPTVPSELTSTTESGDGDPSTLDESLAGKRSC